MANVYLQNRPTIIQKCYGSVIIDTDGVLYYVILKDMVGALNVPKRSKSKYHPPAAIQDSSSRNDNIGKSQ